LDQIQIPQQIFEESKNSIAEQIVENIEPINHPKSSGTVADIQPKS